MTDNGSPKPAFVPIVVGLLEVLKASLWPIAVLLIFSFLYAPLKTILAELPSAIGRADVISIGELKVQLNKALEVSATPEVREALKDLGSNAARRLLRLSTPFLVCQFQHDLTRFADENAADNQLLARKLVTIQDRPADNNAERSKCYLSSPTDLGRRTQDFLIQFLANSLRLGPT